MKNRKKLKKKIKALPPEFAPMEHFLEYKSKLRMVNNFPKVDQKALFYSTTIVSNVNDRLIKKIENEPEFKKILNLFVKSKIDKKLDPELISIYENNTLKFKRELENKRENTFYQILGNQLDNYNNLLNKNTKECFEKCEQIFQNCKKNNINKELVNKLQLIDNHLELCEKNFLFNLSDEMLLVESQDIDAIKYYSVLVYQPKEISFFNVLLEDEWKKFPLRWFVFHLPITTAKNLYNMYKDGEDISNFFIQKYDEKDLDEIMNVLKNNLLNPPNVHIFCGFINKVNEAIECFKKKYYSSSIYSCLPIIEGILWSFSKFLDSKGINIFKDSSDYKILINKDNGKEIKEPTIGDLLKFTIIRDYLDLEFINYFCDELYNERNPILHGKELNFDSNLNAAKKIGTIEYLILTIKSYIETDILVTFNKNIPDSIIEKFLEKHEEKNRNPSHNIS